MENKTFRVVYRRKGCKDIMAGDVLIIKALNEKLARKQAREQFKNMFFGTPVVIAWVDLVL